MRFQSKIPTHVYRIFLILSVPVVLGSCLNAKKGVYFNDVQSSFYRKSLENLEPVIQKNDLLSITVSSVNPEAAEVFNISNLSGAEASTDAGKTAQVSGYLVDQEGLIRFPILGEIRAAGKTKKELRLEITHLLLERKLLLEPIVDVRYLNFKISVLGEVKNPSVLTIPSEKISLLEALGLAGDITVYGKKDNVAIIREQGGLRKIFRIDLTSDELFNSSLYYLKSNDIVYVQAKKSRMASSSFAAQWIPVVLSAISLAVITVVNVR
ncbi:MAG: polysaccharide biosynthesis/export family protein [Flavobacteriaceae bacterium]